MGAGEARPDDGDLVRRWRGGEAGAFATLVRRWQPALARFLTRLTGAPERAADLCQEVFLRAYQAGARYDDRGRFATWLYRIALNAARDWARRGRRAPAPLDAEPAAGTAPADDQLARRELAEAVAQALADLPEPLREVLVLRHYEGLNFEAIARLTGTPASTLKSRFAAALARLRPALQRFAVDFEEANP
jgi:RNA polymerase sigma-70 factor (ECF subfamily)